MSSGILYFDGFSAESQQPPLPKVFADWLEAPTPTTGTTDVADDLSIGTVLADATKPMATLARLIRQGVGALFFALFPMSD